MDIKDVDMNEVGIPNDFLIEVVQKDLETGIHFFYVKIDKKNLTENFENNREEFRKFYEKMYFNFAMKYTHLCFGESLLKDEATQSKTQLQYYLTDLNHERFDEKENTTWLLMKFSFRIVLENNVMVDRAFGVKTIKTDYAPRIMMTDELKAKYPELNELKENEFTGIDKKDALDILKNNT